MSLSNKFCHRVGAMMSHMNGPWPPVHWQNKLFDYKPVNDP